MGEIVSIVYSPRDIEAKPADCYARVAVPAAVLVEGHGIEGDRKGGSRTRQLNVMAAATLGRLAAEGFATGPGQMGEQLVLAGVDVDGLEPGQRLRLGEEAVVEVLSRRTGCDRFEHIQGQPRGSVAGRLGVMAAVVRGGTVRVGDPARVADGEASGAVP